MERTKGKNPSNVQKWQTVGSKKGAVKANSKAGSNKVSRTTGLFHSSAPFSQFREQIEDEEDTDGLPVTSIPAKIGITKAKEFAVSDVTVKKRATKKPKIKKLSFEECLEELNSQEIEEIIEELEEKHKDNHFNILKEINGYLQNIFSGAELEGDYTFSSKPPGYPLSTIPASCQDPLLRVVAQCSPLIQENCFRYCVELLRGGVNSYGTRIMILLLVNCNSSVCVEAAKMIKLLLESNISKVPEALSLLWAGLPHPRLHSFTAVKTWPDLCLPFFQQDNVPRQVLTYVVDYTSLLIRTIGKDNGGVLLELLSPQVVTSILTSQQLLHKRTQKNIQELLKMVQNTVLKVASDSQLAKYFIASFPRLSNDNTVLLGFTLGCLQRSGSSWEVWSRMCSSSPMSSVLLKELSNDEAMPPLRKDKLAAVMDKLSHGVLPKDRHLVKALLSHYPKNIVRSASVDEGEGRWCSLCGFLIFTLSLAYLCILAAFLYLISHHGPKSILNDISNIVGVKEIGDTWRLISSLLATVTSITRELHAAILKTL